MVFAGPRSHWTGRTGWTGRTPGMLTIGMIHWAFDICCPELLVTASSGHTLCPQPDSVILRAGPWSSHPKSPVPAPSQCLAESLAQYLLTLAAVVRSQLSSASSEEDGVKENALHAPSSKRTAEDYNKQELPQLTEVGLGGSW